MNSLDLAKQFQTASLQQNEEVWTFLRSIVKTIYIILRFR